MSKIRLSEMKKGQSGKIISIDQPELEFGLMTLGLLPGDDFLLSDIAPLGGPLALQVNGGKIAVRTGEAKAVWVEVNA